MSTETDIATPDDSPQYRLRDAEKLRETASGPASTPLKKPQSTHRSGRQTGNSPARPFLVALVLALVINLPPIIGFLQVMAGNPAGILGLFLFYFTAPAGGVVLLIGVLLSISRAMRITNSRRQ